MKAIRFTEQTIVIGGKENGQPEYSALPVHIDPIGTAVCCHELTLWERIKVLFTGKIWHSQMTFGQRFHPISHFVDKPTHIFTITDKFYKGDLQLNDIREFYGLPVQRKTATSQN